MGTHRATIRVLIVDDSALIRQILARALSLDPRVEIVGVAQNGVEAIEKARQLNPDVITLDIEMPQLTGIEALPHLAKHSDARVVMLSTLDDPDTTYQALSLGAVDFITKPKRGVASSITDLSDELLKTIKTAYRIDPAAARRGLDARLDQIPPAADETTDASDLTGDLKGLVAIAASTGGPPALERLFSGLDAKLPVAYMVVQHLPHGFSASLARRLNAVGDVRALEAIDQMPVEPGTAYVAPHGVHMRVVMRSLGPRVMLEDSPPVHGVKPAADPLFESVAAAFGGNSVGVVLTGMGADGASGLKVIKDAGGSTIVQNEETSVVWGMPGAAVKLGAARHVTPIGLIAAEVRRAMRGRV